MLSVLGAVYIAYVLAVFAFSFFYQTIRTGPKKAVFTGGVTVVVPFRNEEGHLGRLVQSLQFQNYPNFEVIFINDHSTDNSLHELKKVLGETSFQYKTIQLENRKGKKAAIAEGIKQSEGEIILTTDADCWCGKNWISQMVSPFLDPKIQMVTGPVVLEGTTFFQKCQRVEFGAIIAVSAALVAMHKPTMANGANLAYRRSAFQKVKGFEGIEQTPSGDDELLMMKVTQEFPNSVFFSKSKESVVHTEAQKSVSDFIQQRKRWASKWKVGLRASTIFTALFVYLFQLAQIAVVVLAISNGSLTAKLLTAYVFKVLAEMVLVNNYFQSLRQKYSFFHFLALQTFYPFYVLYVGLISNFGNFQWKGRSFKT